MSSLARSRDAYDRFSAAVEVPLTLLALLWLPVLAVPLIVDLPAAVAATFEAIDYRALRLLRLLNLSRAGVVLANALRRTREIFTHRGLHFVLLAVLGIVFVCSAVRHHHRCRGRGSARVSAAWVLLGSVRAPLASRLDGVCNAGSEVL